VHLNSAADQSLNGCPENIHHARHDQKKRGKVRDSTAANVMENEIEDQKDRDSAHLVERDVRSVRR
jgi:hypothetical protein